MTDPEVTNGPKLDDAEEKHEEEIENMKQVSVQNEIEKCGNMEQSFLDKNEQLSIHHAEELQKCNNFKQFQKLKNLKQKLRNTHMH